MVESMILVTMRMKMPSQKYGEALKILKSAKEYCKYDPGCLSSRIFNDIEEPDVIMLAQFWRSEEELFFYLRSDEYLNLLLVPDMVLEKPEVRFDTISSSTDMETIEKARSHMR